MAIKIAGETVIDDSKNWLGNPISPGGSFTASGSITAGKSVQLLTADGKVQQVTGQLASAGSPVTYETGETRNTVSARNGNTVVNFYYDAGNSSYGTVVAGTVSGDTITFGTPLAINAVATKPLDIVYHSAENKYVVVYSISNATTRYLCVISVSGTTCTAGTPYALYDLTNNIGGYSDATTLCYNPAAGNLLVAGYVYTFDDPSEIPYGRLLVVEIFGNSVTSVIKLTDFVTAYNIGPSKVDLVYHSTQAAFLLAYASSGNHIRAKAFTISGTTVTYGSEVNPFDAINTGYSNVSMTYDSTSGKILFVTQISSDIRVQVCTLTGTTPSFSTSNTITLANNAYAMSTSPVTGVSGIALAYTRGANPFYGYYRTVKISGTSSTISAENEFTSAGVNSDSVLGLTSDNGTGKVVISAGEASGFPGKSRVVTVVSSNISDGAIVLGIAQSSVSNGQSVTVKTLGAIDTQQSGLTINSTYYVNEAGNLSTVSTSPNVLLGKALSATSILITKGI